MQCEALVQGEWNSEGCLISLGLVQIPEHNSLSGLVPGSVPLIINHHADGERPKRYEIVGFGYRDIPNQGRVQIVYVRRFVRARVPRES